MLRFEKTMKEFSMKSPEKCLDSQLWHACAGTMVQMPAVNSKVYYFPQGHAEHAQGFVDFPPSLNVSPLILCRVTAVKFMADPETDEVFAKIRMVPITVRPNELDYNDEDSLGLGMNALEAQDKPASFAKTLTQSDANNGGGFSVPRYCAETIFPPLDYSAVPPVQTVFAKDVHGDIWKFRHIYRGTPRRHLLTTGWSTFVNQKKLVAGDSIVFLRAENGDLCVGIRRAKKGGIGGGSEAPPGWNPLSGNGVSGYGGFSVFDGEEDGKLMRANNNGGNLSSGFGKKGKGKVQADSVIEAATLASKGQPFEVVYYPRASTPEFCVKAAAVKAARRVQWCSGMRFKMPFETEDSSRISWFVGTISSVSLADPVRWPNSPWRVLQVTWDEPDLLQNVKRVSPWLVELASNIPAINLATFSPPRKKLRCPPYTDFSVESQFPTPMFQGTPLVPRSSPFCSFTEGTPIGIQGARHAQFGLSLPDFHLNKLQSGLFQAGFHQLDHATQPAKVSSGVIVGTRSPAINDNESCLLTIGSPSESSKKPSTGKTPHLVLFGKIIHPEEQISSSNSSDVVSPDGTGNSSSEANLEKTANYSDASESAINQIGVANNPFSEGFRWCREWKEMEPGFKTGHCKVFMESEDVGRTLDLSVLGSYAELYKRLSEMFGIGKTDITGHVLYRDSKGAVKQIGNEPFSDFIKTARRLNILMDSGSDNVGMNDLLSNVHLNEQVSC